VTSPGFVVPRPAATVVLLRPGEWGLEVLLTHRPATMAFAAGAFVFPGGRVDPGDADPALAARSVVGAADAAVALGGDLPPEVALAAYLAAIRELFEEAGVLLADTSATDERIREARTALLAGQVALPELAASLDLTLRTDLLAPLSRWVTPSSSPRRFDTRFFAAMLPTGVEPSFEGDEVFAHTWLRPVDALAAMAAGTLLLWLPTSSTLQQLEHVVGLDEIRERLAPGPLAEVVVEPVSESVTAIVMPAGGGVAGQPVNAYLVGKRRFVLVDPGDPTGPALDQAVALAAERGGAIAAIALTHADPDHAAGSEALAERLGIPVLAGPGADRSLPYSVSEVGDLEVIARSDVPITAVHAPGPRPDHLVFIVGDGAAVITGDLDGIRGARTVVGPVDMPALEASRDRLERLAPGALRLPGHPPV
jgi:glyoxylase-like metal-dependent hydrolase (beta-lactamase superfamily II)/8-oxo-dGTP pyrophosphatase MutT (NUDIX family)